MGSTQKPLRAAVVGCRMGAAHARVMAALDDYELVAVCDLVEETARSAAKGAGTPAVYTDFEAMLDRERPEVVAVATPNTSHEALTLRAVQAGVRGICCEKPLAMNMREGRRMVAACREAGVQLICNHQRRMSAALVRMRALIEEGAIGAPYLIRASHAGDLLSDGTHAVDSVRWLAGDRPVKWVLAQVYRDAPDAADRRGGGHEAAGGYRFGHPVETGAVATFEFEGGLRALIFSGKAMLPNRWYQDYEVLGSEGRLWRPSDQVQPPLSIFDRRSDGWQPVPLDPGRAAEEPMTASYREFARMIRQGGGHPLSGDSGLADLEVVMAVYESARTRSRVELPLRQEEFPLAMMLEGD